jgi:2-polyprenyl-3-methyl-5-hydroxy-6-metoxy-1,4-benzoquinol methylase
VKVTREALAAGLRRSSSYTVDPHDQLTFDVVSCLNVLDRCPAPKTLLRQIRDILRPDTGRSLHVIIIPPPPILLLISSSYIFLDAPARRGAAAGGGVTLLPVR